MAKTRPIPDIKDFKLMANKVISASNTLRDVTLFEMGFCTGMRISSILKLNVNDVKKSGQIVSSLTIEKPKVKKNLQNVQVIHHNCKKQDNEKESKGEGIEPSKRATFNDGSNEQKEKNKKPKEPKSQVIYLNKSIRERLETYTKYMEEDDTPLFASHNNKRLTRQAVSYIIKKVALKAGLGVNVNTHSLRKTFAQELLDKGTDIVTIKELLGHESIKTTEKYLESNEKKKIMALEKIDI